MAVGGGDGSQDEDPRLDTEFHSPAIHQGITTAAAADLDQWVTMAGARLDPVSAPVAGDEQALPGWRGRAVCRLALGADDADEAKAPPCGRVEGLGVLGRAHGGWPAACLAWATAAVTSAPAAWTATGASMAPQA